MRLIKALMTVVNTEPVNKIVEIGCRFKGCIPDFWRSASHAVWRIKSPTESRALVVHKGRQSSPPKRGSWSRAPESKQFLLIDKVV